VAIGRLSNGFTKGTRTSTSQSARFKNYTGSPEPASAMRGRSRRETATSSSGTRTALFASASGLLVQSKLRSSPRGWSRFGTDAWKKSGSIRSSRLEPSVSISFASTPFATGNGRVSRLLLLLQSCQVGYGVGRYISLDRLIENSIERYYETLEIGSQGWHQGKHDPWPHIGYLLFILNDAYREFQERIG